MMALSDVHKHGPGRAEPTMAGSGHKSGPVKAAHQRDTHRGTKVETRAHDAVFGILLIGPYIALVAQNHPLTANAFSRVTWWLLIYGPIAAISISHALRNPRLLMRLNVPGFTFVLLALASTLYSEDPSATLIEGCRLLLFAVFISLTIQSRWLESAKRSQDQIAVFTVVAITQLIGLTLLARGAESALGTEDRFAGVTSNPTFSGMLSAYVLPMIFSCFSCARSLFIKIVILTSFPILVSALILSGSRGALLGACVGIAVALLTERKWATLALISYASIATALLGETLAAEASSTLRKHLIRENTADWSTGRIQIYSELIEKWNKSPIRGSGFSTAVLDRYNGLVLGHNIYLSILVELGCIGFLLMLIVILQNLGHYIRAPRRSSLAGACTAILVVEGTESSFFGFGSPTTLVAWIITGMFVSSSRAPYSNEANHRPGNKES